MRISVKLLGIVCIICMLGGCDLAKNNEGHQLKEKFSVLNQIYPTKEVDSLFKQFPKGFKIQNRRRVGDISVTVEVMGDSTTKTITGKVTQEQTKPNDKDEVLLSEDIYYQEGAFHLIANGEALEILKDFKFLFQVYDFNRFMKVDMEPLAMRSGETMYTNDYFLVYNIEDDVLADYMQVPTSTVLHMSVDGSFKADQAGKFQKSIQVRSMEQKSSVFELITAE